MVHSLRMASHTQRKKTSGVAKKVVSQRSPAADALQATFEGTSMATAFWAKSQPVALTSSSEMDFNVEDGKREKRAGSSRYSYSCEQGEKWGFPLLKIHRVVVKKCSKLRTSLFHLFSISLVLALSYSLLFSIIPVAVGFQWLILTCGLFNLVLQRNAVEEETVVVMPTFGVQLETSYSSGKVRRQFVPLKQILAAVINEAVTPTSCYYYLALLPRDDSKLVLAFKEVRPPLHMLVPIWKSLCEAVGI